VNARGQGTVTYDKTKRKWIARIPMGRRDNGTTIYRKRQASTKREAQVARQALLLERDTQPDCATPIATNETLFKTFADDHMRHEASNELRATTCAGYSYVLHKYVYPTYGNRMLETITSIELAKFFSTMRDDYSASQVNYTRAVMSRIFNAGMTHRLIDDNPIRRTKKMRPRPDDRVLVQPHWTLEECQEALTASAGTPFDLFIRLAIYTGMRHGELLGLFWDDIDLDLRTLTVHRTIAEPKGPRGTDERGTAPYFNEPKTSLGRRTLQLSDDLVNAFVRHRLEQVQVIERTEQWYWTNCVFTSSNGKPFWPSNHSGYFRNFLRANGLRHIRVHDIRHSFAVNALELGIDLPSISRALGHSSLQITMDVYGRGAGALQNRATDGIANYFGRDSTK